MILNQKPHQQRVWKMQTTSAGSFHVKLTKAGHEPSESLLKLFWMKGIYEIRLSWKFQHKPRTCSKVMAPQSWHGKLKIDKTRGVRHFWVSITFFVLNLAFLNLLHSFCAQKTLRSEYQKFFLRIHNGINKINISLVEWSQDYPDWPIYDKRSNYCLFFWLGNDAYYHKP